ncbi:MAG: hypothetical protein Q9183_006215 [Haloplaca sp. 2 TL-2023]
MAMRGQRFHLDLDSNEQSSQEHDNHLLSKPRNQWGLVTDIKERSIPTAAKTPSPPQTKNPHIGFPGHKKRHKPSVFKQRTASQGNSQTSKTKPTCQEEEHTVTASTGATGSSQERMEIDRENRQRLAEMSAEDIDDAKRELMAGLNPSLIERFLKRANIEEDLDTPDTSKLGPSEIPSYKITASTERDAGSHLPVPEIRLSHPGHEPEIPPREPDNTLQNSSIDSQPVSATSGYPAPPSFHFPRPPTPPSLDPEDPDFLSKLHSTYFPSLPSDPSSLSWMQPPSPSENDVYSPSLSNVHPSAVRFDFRGRLLPPRLASQIPATKGLHHHGTAPEAAGYTIPELAHLSRSSFPSQRCIAYQTLGRILYRLGTGVFGTDDHELCQGLWKCIEQGRVLDTLTTEAARDANSGNRSCWATATEALWLWRKSGGRKWKAT